MRDTAPLTTLRWGVPTALVLTAYTSGITVAAGLLGAAVGTVPTLGEDLSALITGGVLVLSYLLIIGVVWAVARVSSATLSGAVGLRPFPLGSTIALGLGVALGARFAAGVYGIVLQMLGVELPGQDIDPTTLLPSGPVGILFTLLLACVFAPIAEEIVFRGVLLTALRDRWGNAVGIGVSSAVFAVIHVYLYAIPPIFVLALVLGILFVRTRSLWTAIVAHGLFNAIGIAAIYALRGAGVL